MEGNPSLIRKAAVTVRVPSDGRGPPTTIARGEDEHGVDVLDGGDDDQVYGEPNLGAPENHHDQVRWSQGGSRDGEIRD